jgi:hypothetical protein
MVASPSKEGFAMNLTPLRPIHAHPTSDPWLGQASEAQMAERSSTKKNPLVTPIRVVVLLSVLGAGGGYWVNRARGPSVDVVTATRGRVVERVVATGKVRGFQSNSCS